MAEPCPPTNGGPSTPCSASQSKIREDDRGRYRARGYYPVLGPCQECGAPAKWRRHLDGNPSNNAPDNVRQRCARCALVLSGHTARLVEAGNAANRARRAHRAAMGLDRCVHCGKQGTLRQGLCGACYTYRRKHDGAWRPLIDRAKRVCAHCHAPAPAGKSAGGLCQSCRGYVRRHNGELPPQELLDRRGDHGKRPSERSEGAATRGTDEATQRGPQPA